MDELQRRWQMVLGGENTELSENDRRISHALDALYGILSICKRWRKLNLLLIFSVSGQIIKKVLVILSMS